MFTPREERSLGRFRDDGGIDDSRPGARRLTGNFNTDVRSGAFRMDESDPEWEPMHQWVAANVPGEEGRRLDAGETATITRQLLYVKARTYDIKYPMFRARDFIPVTHDVPTGAEQWSYWQYDSYGMAKIIANYATDFPRVDVKVLEFKQPIVPLGVAYGYTVQDLRRIAFMAASGTQRGANIDVKRAARARMANEAAIDDIASVGAPDAAFNGFINNVNVPIAALPTGNWATASSLQIIADMGFGPQTIVTTTNQVEQPDTMLFSNKTFAIITQQPFSTLGNHTVATWFKENNPYIKEMDQWYKLNKANAGGTGSRLVCYHRHPDWVFMEIPQEFEQFAPQLEGMEYEVPCHSRMGGVAWPYPLSGIYLDGAD